VTSYGGKSYAAQFAVVYTLLALVVPLAGILAYKELTTPVVKSPKTVVHKQDLGITAAAVIAEKGVQTQADQAGLLVKSQTVVKVSENQDGATVTLKVVVVDPLGNQRTLKLNVHEQKSLYSVSGITA